MPVMAATMMGSVGISSAPVIQLCASRKLRANEATRVSRAAANGTNGSSDKNTPVSTLGPRFALMPMDSNGTKRSEMANDASVNTNDTPENTIVATNFPATSASRETGNETKGSSEPRSLSPAVASMATYMPPMSVENSKK